MPNEFESDVQQEGERVLDDQGEKVEKTTSESTTEKKQADTKPAREGDNTHDGDGTEPPKENKGWIKMRKENKELREQIDKLNSRFTEVEPLLKERTSKEVELPDWWKKAYGDTPESKQSYRNYEDATKAERDRIKSELREELKAEQTQSSQQDIVAKEFIENEISDMKDEGLEFETNELMKFILDFQDKYGSGSLLDSTGNNYDLRKCLNLMQELQPKVKNDSTNIKKQVASGTVTKGKTITQKSNDIPVLTRKSLRGSWRDVQ